MYGLGFLVFTGAGFSWRVLLHLVIHNAIVLALFAAAIGFGLRIGLGI